MGVTKRANAFFGLCLAWALVGCVGNLGLAGHDGPDADVAMAPVDDSGAQADVVQPTQDAPGPADGGTLGVNPPEASTAPANAADAGTSDAPSSMATPDASSPSIDVADAAPSDAASSATPDASSPPVDAGVDPCSVSNGGCGNPALFSCTHDPEAGAVCAARPEVLVTTGSLTGTVPGLSPDAVAKVTLGSDAYLVTQTVGAGQLYLFDHIPPGTYFLKLDVTGYASPKALAVQVSAPAPVALANPAQPGLTLASAPSTRVDLPTSGLSADAFTFHWEEDRSRAGQNQTAYVVAPPTIQFLDQSVHVPDAPSADQLTHDYNVILSDEGQPWDEEHAYRLLETMKAIPQTTRDPSAGQTLAPSKWVLTTSVLVGDIQIASAAGGNTVTVSDAAFVNAAPKIVTLDGVRGTFFSQRLHHALVRYVTRDGTDSNAVEKILNTRYGCSTVIPNYQALTAPTTHETAAHFQPFFPNELVTMINMFEEMPSGFHAVQGLKYLVRRKDGMQHPLYPSAAAVAWAFPDLFPAGSYIEFMEVAFTADPVETHRLILHEKGHFLWGYIFSDGLKADWATLGGWYRDPGSLSGWSTTKEIEFVSAYSHLKNPDEDMAESLAFYVLDPAALLSRAPEKYAFIRDRVMKGDRYISTIPQALTFQVLDLFPDYTFPGKIDRVDIRVEGAADQDKTVTVEIGLNTLQNVFAGAQSANLRLYSSAGTYEDVWLAATDATQAVLRGTFTLSKYAKSGLWRPDQIVLNDAVGNQRFAGENDFGWRLLINNSLEDITPPKYVPQSLQVSVTPSTYVENGTTYPVYDAHVTFRVDDAAMGTGQSVVAWFANSATYSKNTWGSVDPQTMQASIDFLMTDFDAHGAWGVPTLLMIDAAGNRAWANFSSAPGNEAETFVTIDSKTPDTTPPEVSLNDDPAHGLHAIQISAHPTHPDAPDGETAVTIDYQARDDLSGLGMVSYRLLDPQGVSHMQYDYHPNFYTKFFEGDPTAWAEYRISVILPVGSAPGTWGLQELYAPDKVGNVHDLDFVETMHFEVQ